MTATSQLAESARRDEVKNLFDLYYGEYRILDLIGEVQGCRVLDAGCGSGRKASELVERGASVVGVDNDPDAISVARTRVDAFAEFHVADLREPLSFLESESFDLIIASLVLHYLADWNLALSEFARVLRSSGRLVFSIHHPFMDFVESESFDYFAVQQWEFKTDAEPPQTHVFWRRPLEKVFEPLMQNEFIVRSVIEPLPSPSTETKNPRLFSALSTAPRLLMVAAGKQPS